MPAFRLVYRSLLLGLLVFTGALITPLLQRGHMPRHGLAAIVTCAWHRGIARATGIRVIVHGQARPQATLYVANHISWFDIIALGGHLPLRFLSKAEVRRWPLVGWLASRAGTLYIERGNHRATAEANRRMREALELGENVCLFPEGTTSDGQVRKFHSRLMQCAIDAGSSIQPVAIAYPPPPGETTPVHPAMLFTGSIRMGESYRRVLSARHVEAHVYLLPAIDCTGKNRNAIARQAQQAITRALESSR